MNQLNPRSPMAEYRMPSLGADMTDGRVVEWFVGPGDPVHRGDVVGVVDTNKGAIEMEFWEDGVVEEIVVAPGEKIPVGEVLLRFRPAEEVLRPAEGAPGPGEAPPSPAEDAPHPKERPRPEVRLPGAGGPAGERAIERAARPAEPRRAEAAPPDRARIPASPAARKRARELGIDLARLEGSGPGGAVVLQDVVASAGGREEAKVHATPVARRIAEVHGVDLSTVAGTGPGGMVTRGDIEAAAGIADGERQTTARAGARERKEARAGPGAEDADEPSERLARMREAIAAAMARSKREIPHYYLATTVDILWATQWLDEENGRRSPEKRILSVALFLKAGALAARDFPELNGHWVEGGFRPSREVHPGLAISLRGGGLVAPAVHDADRRTLEELTRAVADLVQRARVGRLRSSEVTDATLTVSSLGDRGVETLYGVIYPPQVALLGVGRIVERPWAHEGMVGVRPVVQLTLSGDHRASDGHRGGLFLESVATLLQRPEEL